MKVGLIGLGRMGEGMSRRMMKAGIEVWGYRRNYEKANEAYENGYVNGITTSIQSLAQVVKHTQSGVSDKYGPGIFMMVVPAETVEETINELLRYCDEGDIIIDHGNSNFKDSRKRAERLAKLGIQYIDCGTSGGVYGLDRGYCLMVGGGNTAVKMVHNGIEYGIMQAYAEGFNILKNANAGAQYVREGDAEVAPMADPESYCYDIDVAEVAELWRRGSVVGSWLLDLTADVLRRDGELKQFSGGVSDSGEGRWTVSAAVDLGVPAPVITTALFERFNSRNLGSFGAKILNGMRYMFGGHHVR